MSESLRDMMVRRRTELRISQEDVAERMGMSQEWYSKLERGQHKRSLRTDLLILLAESLETPYDEVAVAAGITHTYEAARKLLARYRAELMASEQVEDRDRLIALHAEFDDKLLQLTPMKRKAIHRILDTMVGTETTPGASDPHDQQPASPQGKMDTNGMGHE